MTKKELISLAKEMIAAPSCCAELKEAGLAWVELAEKEQEAAEKLVAEIKEDVTGIDGLVAFAHSPQAVELFGEENAKNFAAHADELKGKGAEYCDCAACKPALEILANRKVLLD